MLDLTWNEYEVYPECEECGWVLTPELPGMCYCDGIVSLDEYVEEEDGY